MELKWNQKTIVESQMPTNLSIKNVPDELAAQIKKRAAKNHRSLQGELVAIIEAAAKEDRRLKPLEFLAAIKSFKLSTPTESASMVRGDRETH